MNDVDTVALLATIGGFIAGYAVCHLRRLYKAATRQERRSGGDRRAHVRVRSSYVCHSCGFGSSVGYTTCPGCGRTKTVGPVT